MKKYSVAFILYFLLLGQAFAKPTCEGLFERTLVIANENQLSKSYELYADTAKKILDHPDFTSVFYGHLNPDWNAYKSITDYLEILDSTKFKKLSDSEKKILEKEFFTVTENLENKLDELLQQRYFLNSYKRRIDRNYNFFELLDKVNKKIGVKVFPVARFDLTPSNYQTTQQAKKLVSELNKNFDKDFVEYSGYRSLDAYKKHASTIDEVTQKTVDLLENHVIVALHAPVSVRAKIILIGFQNQRMTESSKGNLNVNERNFSEARNSGIKNADYLKRSIRFMPKYAEAIVGPEIKNITNGREADMYGNDLWIIKKSVVQERATWTPKDSLSTWGDDLGTKLDGYIPWAFRSLATPYMYQSMKTFSKFEPLDILPSLSFNSQEWSKGKDYLEVQIFGDVSLNDVEAFHFRGVPPSQKMMNLFKSKNIEVYDARNVNPVRYDIP